MRQEFRKTPTLIFYSYERMFLRNDLCQIGMYGRMNMQSDLNLFYWR
jgi:hypothetical protein